MMDIDQVLAFAGERPKEPAGDESFFVLVVAGGQMLWRTQNIALDDAYKFAHLTADDIRDEMKKQQR